MKSLPRVHQKFRFGLGFGLGFGLLKSCLTFGEVPSSVRSKKIIPPYCRLTLNYVILYLLLSIFLMTAKTFKKADVTSSLSLSSRA